MQLHGEDKAVSQKDGSSKLMKCSKEAVYIGKTCQRFRERMGPHIRSVSPFWGLGETTTPVGFHFALPGHQMQHMQCMALEQVKSKDQYIILARESEDIKPSLIGLTPIPVILGHIFTF